jgi:transposase InsO family protein
VRQELRQAYGKPVSVKKAARLMRENRLNARRLGKHVRTTDWRHSLPVCANILNREFHAAQGGQKWVSDITCLRTAGGWACLTVALDLFDRKVIGWALSAGMETSAAAVAALAMAVKNRPAQDGMIFHGDRGAQYCAESFRDALRAWRPAVRQSMSRKGNCWDNACAESFFKTLKRELETLDGRRSAARGAHRLYCCALPPIIPGLLVRRGNRTRAFARWRVYLPGDTSLNFFCKKCYFFREY